MTDCHAGTSGSIPPPGMKFFSFKIQETCVKKIRNFMRVYVKRKRAV